MKKALILSGNEYECSAIIETETGLLFTQCYTHALDQYFTRQAENNNIMEGFSNFYSYFNK
jgi:hypothetical protein